MGNHTAGLAMGKAAEQAIANRRPSEAALSILDRICEPYRGCDAEFESEDSGTPGKVHPEFDDFREPHPAAALGMLMLEAFAPNGVSDLERYRPMLDGSGGEEAEEKACDAWWDEVNNPFKARYDFC